ncbi:LysR family transcriptional regulator [Streptomyces sp. NPDC015220]|uniref:LysR family transcriptional regulator n=1 Tax=Streptomyces sp. NPDC015220 TaxID=3364947 RepID=UPI0036FD6F52
MDLLAHLEAYAAAVDEASFSRAADRLGIAQPLLSRRVKTLEAHLGGLLFDRSRRQVEVTELGVLLLPYARDVLDRAERLRHVARSAQRSAVRAVGVPADCAPAALARVIRAGAERGITLKVRELPPGERESGLADGSLAYALVRVQPEDASLRVPIGLASAPPAGAPEGTAAASDGAAAAAVAPASHGARTKSRPRAVHLEELRPRRRQGPLRTRPSALPVLVLPEDQVPYARDRLGRAAARAGLPEALFRPAGPVATALAETLAGRVTLLCTEPFARMHGAGWAPLNDASLHRGYVPRASPGRSGSADVPGWLAALLVAGVGAAPTAPATARSYRSGEDAVSRLAARG